MPIVLGLSLPFLFLIARRPVLRRLAFRNAVRRPREAALVVVGSLFGTAIITGSLIVADTMNTSIRGLAYQRLGPIDEVVVTTDRAIFSEALSRIQGARSDLMDGVLPFGHLLVAAATGEEGGGEARRAVPDAEIVELDFAAARRFGEDPASTGIEGETPPAGHAAVTDALARQLGVGPGDAIAVFAYGRSEALEIDRVLDARGVAGFRTGFFNEPSANILVGPGLLDRLSAGVAPAVAAGQFAPPEWVVAVSNRGDVEGGDVHTAEVTRQMERALEGVPLSVIQAKHDILDEAERNSAQFSELFTAMGSFGILAGVLLLVNIFVMLAEERKSELGMLRAVGLRRWSLVGAFSLEGWAYSLGAALVGTFVGLGLGAAIIEFIRRIFEAENEVIGIPLTFDADPSSLQSGFAIGFAIALVTVVLTSWRISRFNVIRAIRELPEPRRERTRIRWRVAGALAVALGGSMAVAGIAGSVPVAALLGPVFVLMGLVPLVSDAVGFRRASTTASALILVWSVLAFGVLDFFTQEGGIFIFVIQGVVLTAAAVTLVAQEQEALERLASRLGVGRWAMALRLGLAYPVARRFRTGLTLAMYSLVIFTLTFISTLSAIFTGQLDETAREVAGGYEVFVTSNPANPVDLNTLGEVEGVRGAAPLARIQTKFKPGSEEEEFWTLSAFDERLLTTAHPPLIDDRGTYATDEEVYRAVLADPSLIIADEFFLQGEGGPPENPTDVGDVVLMIDPRTGKFREVTVAALGAPDFLINGALYGYDGAREFFGDRVVPDRAYIDVEGRDPAAVAAAISGSYIQSGADAEVIRTIIREFLAIQDQFFRLFQGYLGFGLIVGIAGLGVVMVRAVRERRREIGVLRSLGFESATVRRSFLFESTFVALEGTLIGAVLALITAYNVFTNSDAFGEGVRFIIPVATLTVVLLGTLAASLLATAAPTRAAARIRPAVALRIAD